MHTDSFKNSFTSNSGKYNQVMTEFFFRRHVVVSKVNKRKKNGITINQE